MAQIMTVLGPINPEELGITSMHEHTLCDCSIFRNRFESFLPPDPPIDPDKPISMEDLCILRHGFVLSRQTLKMVEEDVITQEITDFKASGGSALVDMSTPGIRWDVAGLQRISQKAGVHIVAPTGLYAYDTWPAEFRDWTLEEMCTFMLDEVKNGIERTGIYPGHIKVAMDTKFHTQEVNAIRAAVRVAQETNLLVTIHQGMFVDEAGELEIIKILKSEGANLDRVVMAHTDSHFWEGSLPKLILEPESCRLNLDVTRAMLDTGINISLDLFGHTWDAEGIGVINATDWQRMAGLVALMKAGYSRQIVLGTDSFFKLQLRRFGGEGYRRLTSFVLPTLHGLNLPPADINALMVDNPARLLAV